MLEISSEMSNFAARGIWESAALLGDFHPLVEQLGSSEGLVTLSTTAKQLHVPSIETLSDLRVFLRAYQRTFLLPLEIPLIHQAFHHASGNELKELIQLDRSLLHHPEFSLFANPSRRIGHVQIKKLRPLQDVRLVQRYLHSVEAREAEGWHILVFGLTLHVYSLPLRQGLLHYAYQTQSSFIHSASRKLRLSHSEFETLLAELITPLSQTLDRLLA